LLDELDELDAEVRPRPPAARRSSIGVQWIALDAPSLVDVGDAIAPSRAERASACPGSTSSSVQQQ
jgi:hypothetical protein